MLSSYINTWKKSFDFSGQSSRKDFWIFKIVNWIIILIPIAVITDKLQDFNKIKPLSDVGITIGKIIIVLYLLFYILSVFSGFSLFVRRINDRNIKRNLPMMTCGIFVLCNYYLLYDMISFMMSASKNQVITKPLSSPFVGLCLFLLPFLFLYVLISANLKKKNIPVVLPPIPSNM